MQVDVSTRVSTFAVSIMRRAPPSESLRKAAVMGGNAAELRLALFLVKKDGMCVRNAALRSKGILLQLQRVLSENMLIGRVGDGCAVKEAGHSGRRPLLLEVKEETTLRAACKLARLGTPLSRDGLFDKAQKFLFFLSTSRRAPVAFENDHPGDFWVSAFILKNPSLTLRLHVNQ